jgi:hypothetical protein
MSKKTPNNQIKKWVKDLSKEYTKMAKPNMKTYSISLIIRELQIKTTTRYHLMPVIKNK